LHTTTIRPLYLIKPGAHACFMMSNHLNIIVESLVYVLYVQDNLGSNLGLETGYAVLGDSESLSLQINVG
jgi:hypothetical protein